MKDASRTLIRWKSSLSILLCAVGALTAFSAAGQTGGSISVIPIGDLPPGGSVVPADGSSPDGAVLMDTRTSPYSGADIQGTVISRVYSGDAGNLMGGLTFTYEILSGATSLQDVSRFSVGNYGGFQTAVSYNLAAVPGLTPSLATRSTGVGDIVRFDFAGIAPGQNSTLLVIQTDAIDYAQTIASVINAGSAEVLSLAPIAVPEPTTFLLFGMGFLALAPTLRRR